MEQAATDPKAKRAPRRRTKQFAEMLLHVSNEMAVLKTLDEALETLVSITTAAIGAERGTIFLNDRQSGELYSRVAQGNFRREIRILNDSGIAGWVFTNDEGVIVADAYADERFNPDVDERTGYKTQNVLCAPLKSPRGEILGVSQLLNKEDGAFTPDDLELLTAMTEQAAIVLQGNLMVEEMEAARRQELEFLDVVSQVSTELQLGPLLGKIIAAITKMLDAERSTLFINDEKRGELFTLVGEGLGATEIRLANDQGIAGAVFTSGQSINLPHAYADLRFNPAFDRQTGFFTRSLLCVPVFNKKGRVIGTTQVLNKRGGPFTADDEARLEAFTSQISMSIENATLFNDVQNMKNYNESMLESMSNGVITINEEGEIVTCNSAGIRIMNIKDSAQILNKDAAAFFGKTNEWVLTKLTQVQQQREEIEVIDVELHCGGKDVSVNATFLPLTGADHEHLGSMIMLEDISTEKRMKSTMSLHMDPLLADRLIEGDQRTLEGVSSVATVLFSDIRGFTPLTEALGAQGTVKLLNEYFTLMVDCIQNEDGMLDKFIGDAILAVFGSPVTHDDDPDRGLRTAIEMMHALNRYNVKRRAHGSRTVDHGIGLNTDTIFSGNIGSPKRQNFTVIGDGVNLAARLESACKQYGAHILMSEYTYGSLKATYRTREIDRVIVKGKSESVGVYEVMDYHDDESYPNMTEALGHFNDATSYYKNADWDAAIAKFKDVLALNPNDTCSAMYVDRCETLKQTPPEGDWDGIWVMTSK